MKKTQLPDWLYQLLPYFYAGVGLLTIVILRNGMAVFSGLTLLSAGGAVGMLRYRYRHGIGQGAERPGVENFADAERAHGAPVQIAWRTAYETGNAVVDAQHRKLFGLGNTLINAVLSKQSQPDIQWPIEELIEHIKAHFHTEEADPTWTTHPNFREHQEIHNSLLAKADDIRDRFYANPTAANDLLSYVARDVIMDHISREILETSA